MEQSASIAFALFGVRVLQGSLDPGRRERALGARSGWVDNFFSNTLALGFKADGLRSSTAPTMLRSFQGKAAEDAAERVARVLDNEGRSAADRILSALR